MQSRKIQLGIRSSDIVWELAMSREVSRYGGHRERAVESFEYFQSTELFSRAELA